MVSLHQPSEGSHACTSRHRGLGECWWAARGASMKRLLLFLALPVACFSPLLVGALVDGMQGTG